MRIPTVGLLLTLAVPLTSGCGGTKLDMESSFEVALNGKTFVVEAIKREQTVKASLTATGAPVNIYIYLEKDQTSAERLINAKKAGDAVLARQEGAQEATIEAVIPANESAIVQVTRASGKSAQVKLRITNR